MCRFDMVPGMNDSRETRRLKCIAYTQKWARANPDKIRARDRAKGLRAFGLTPEAYDTLLARQNGHCAICPATPGRIRLAVDHCHVTGRVRGLLCTNCNNGLGRFRDDPALLTRAAEYLQSTRAS